MSRGRPPRIDRPVKWRISIPRSLAAATVHTLSRQNADRTINYGDRAALFDRLLRKWLREQGVDPNSFLNDTSLDEFL